ncbi:hypothetical protein AMELA_G00272400 [Ameiurus melas]|uniref:Uncharacterized protein n=1 Tax=Ameiurus melas TaxID=219545 RepID=A0A7J5ZQ65_AMEME|nr:hypothetical protein AMELA_G00272400 [Ameiurus melas]
MFVAASPSLRGLCVSDTLTTWSPKPHSTKKETEPFDKPRTSTPPTSHPHPTVPQLRDPVRGPFRGGADTVALKEQIFTHNTNSTDSELLKDQGCLLLEL